jgi:hypothetical protein
MAARTVLASSYAFVMPLKSLRQGRTSRIPAMAIRLPDYSWSSREHIWLPVHTAPGLTKQMDEQIARLLTPALQDLPRGRTQAPPPVETIEEHEQEAAPLPKAA